MARETNIRSQALRSLYDEHFRDNPERLASLQEEMLKAEIAQCLYDLRMGLNLSQQELAERVGIDATVISDIEETDFAGDSMEMLNKICTFLGTSVKVGSKEEFAMLEPGRGDSLNQP